MNRLNRKIEYALMALKVMAERRAGEVTSAKEVVDLTGCPFDPTARVLQQMAQVGWLRSEQGAHGGYILVRDLMRVSFYDLAELIVGPVHVARCLGNESACDLINTCTIQSPVSILNRRLMEFYRSLSVGEILRLKDKPADLKEVSV